MKIILQIIGGIFLVFALVAGFSSARDWLILNKLSGYEKDQFTITGVRVIHRSGDDGTDYYLQGHGARGEYEFAISAARYETLSSAAGQKIIVFRNPSMLSLSSQKESINVIFEDDWREREEVELSAKSTMWMGLIAMAVSVFALVFARSVSRHRAKAVQGSESDPATFRVSP